TVRESDDFSACLGAGQRPSGGAEDTVIIQSTPPWHWEYRIDECFGFSWRMWVRARRGAYSLSFPDWRRRRIARRSVEGGQLPRNRRRRGPSSTKHALSDAGGGRRSRQDVQPQQPHDELDLRACRA